MGVMNKTYSFSSEWPGTTAKIATARMLDALRDMAEKLAMVSIFQSALIEQLKIVEDQHRAAEQHVAYQNELAGCEATQRECKDDGPIIDGTWRTNPGAGERMMADFLVEPKNRDLWVVWQAIKFLRRITGATEITDRTFEALVRVDAKLAVIIPVDKAATTLHDAIIAKGTTQ